jgi:integrase
LTTARYARCRATGRAELSLAAVLDKLPLLIRALQCLPLLLELAAYQQIAIYQDARFAAEAILDKAELHRRGPHQMRHTFASLLLQAGAPITYVSRQLGHKDSAITLRVYAHWLPESSGWKGVDWLDDARPSATPAQPAR